VDPDSLISAVRNAILQIDPDQPVFNVHTMEQVISGSLKDFRFNMLLLGMFAGLALILASIGIYGVLAYTLKLRTREIGIRIAIGAQKRDIFKLVIGQGLILTLIGIGVGEVAAIGLTRLMSSMLYGVQPLNLFTFVIAFLVLIVVALAASWIPARRAMQVDPIKVLRYE
ncbi:MAG: FtsX-like permease family protein, partial [Pyrinomonadaceae bacterium]